MSVEEYLHTSFPDLDKEYRDGELIDRSMPDYPHSRAQIRLGSFFETRPQALRLYPGSELRLKIRDGLYRIPDIAVFHPTEPAEGVPSLLPFIVIEILSPDDRMTAVIEKLDDYKTWGVPHVWFVDPHSRRLYTYDQGLHAVEALRVPELDLAVTRADVFKP
jgi:Uma2 family endonuclease